MKKSDVIDEFGLIHLNNGNFAGTFETVNGFLAAIQRFEKTVGEGEEMYDAEFVKVGRFDVAKEKYIDELESLSMAHTGSLPWYDADQLDWTMPVYILFVT